MRLNSAHLGELLEVRPDVEARDPRADDAMRRAEGHSEDAGKASAGDVLDALVAGGAARVREQAGDLKRGRERGERGGEERIGEGGERGEEEGRGRGEGRRGGGGRKTGGEQR